MTLLEQLTEAFPDQIERIKACAAPDDDLSGPAVRTAGDALSRVFVWIQTDEGQNYWANLARSKGWGH